MAQSAKRKLWSDAGMAAAVNCVLNEGMDPMQMSSDSLRPSSAEQSWYYLHTVPGLLP